MKEAVSEGITTEPENFKAGPFHRLLPSTIAILTVVEVLLGTAAPSVAFNLPDGSPQLDTKLFSGDGGRVTRSMLTNDFITEKQQWNDQVLIGVGATNYHQKTSPFCTYARRNRLRQTLPPWVI